MNAKKWNIGPGWWMAYADPKGRHEAYAIDEVDWPWGIGTSQSQTAIHTWDFHPWPKPGPYAENLGDWIEDAGNFDEDLMLGLEDAHALVELCTALGYKDDKESQFGWCAWWLFDYMGKLVAENPDGV